MASAGASKAVRAAMLLLLLVGIAGLVWWLVDSDGSAKPIARPSASGPAEVPTPSVFPPSNSKPASPTNPDAAPTKVENHPPEPSAVEAPAAPIAPESTPAAPTKPPVLWFRTNPVLELPPKVELLDRNAMTSPSRRPRPGEALPPARVPTRLADGRWEVEEVFADVCGIRVTADGYLPAKHPVSPVSGENCDAGTVELVQAKSLRGRVVNIRGLGVADATVLAISVMGSGAKPRSRGGMAGYSCESGDDGSFALTGLPRGVIELWASHSTSASRVRSTVITDDAAEVIELVLLELGRLDGVVIPPPGATPPVLRNNHLGVPSSSLHARIFDAGSQEAELMRHPNSRDIFLDDCWRAGVAQDWTFSLPLLPGKYVVTLALGGDWVVQDAEVPDHGAGQVTLRFDVLCGVRGTITGPNGQPLSGATVELHGQSRSSFPIQMPSYKTPIATATTNALGEYEILGCKPGQFVLSIAGYERYLPFPEDGRTANVVNTKRGEVTTADLDLSKSAAGAAVWVTMTVNGSSVTDYALVPSHTESGRKVPHPGFVLFADGRALATGVPEGSHRADVLVRLLNREFVNLKSNFTYSVAPSLSDVHITHDIKTAKLKGQVVIPPDSGEIPTTITVVPWSIAGPGAPSSRTGGVQHTCDGEGRFDGKTVACGWYRIVVRSKLHLEFTIEVEITGDTDLQLHLGDKGGTILLTFDGLDGGTEGELKVLSVYFGLEMWHLRNATMTLPLMTRPDVASDPKNLHVIKPGGNQRFSAIPPGTYTLTASHDLIMRYEVPVTITSGAETVVSVRPRMARKITIEVPSTQVPADCVATELRVYVRGPRAWDMPLLAWVTLKRTPEGGYRGEGRATFSGPATFGSGDISLIVSPATASVVIPDGADSTFTISLERKPK